MGLAWVYRYTDNTDGVIKYVGIVWSENRSLGQRIYEHQNNDSWCINGDFKIEYIEENINSRTDAEFFESHYISLYRTDRYYNKAKSGWGVSSYLPNRENEWTEYIDKPIDECVYRVCWTTGNTFDVKRIPIIKKTHSLKQGQKYYCVRCGGNDLEEGTKGFLRCRECDKSWYTNQKYWTRVYSAVLNHEKDINYYTTYTLCYGREDCWVSCEENILQHVHNIYPMDSSYHSKRLHTLTKIHTYALTQEQITEAKTRISDYLIKDNREQINSIKTEIKSLNLKVKNLKREVEERIRQESFLSEELKDLLTVF